MISFDYLHGARERALRRALENVPECMQNAAIAMIVAILIVAAAWVIDAHRLREAQQMQARYERSYELSRIALQRSDIYYVHVRRLAALDSRVRALSRTGYEDARRLAGIANALPLHVWLNAISADSTGLVLEGRARDLKALSRTIRALAANREVHDPILTGAARIVDPGRAPNFRYSLHVENLAR